MTPKASLNHLVTNTAFSVTNAAFSVTNAVCVMWLAQQQLIFQQKWLGIQVT